MLHLSDYIHIALTGKVPWRKELSSVPNSTTYLGANGHRANQNSKNPKKRKPTVITKPGDTYNGFDWNQIDNSTDLANTENELSLYEEYQNHFAVCLGDILQPSGPRKKRPYSGGPDRIQPGCFDILFQCKVYIFGGWYLAEPLKGLSLQKIRLELTEDDCDYDILVKALDYTYATTHRKQSCNDQLREVLVAFASSEAKILYIMPKFMELPTRNFRPTWALL